MKTNFQLFGPAHIAILLSPFVIAAVLAAAKRLLPPASQSLNYALAWLIALETLAWDIYLFARGQLSFPAHLPVELCDLTIYFTVAALFTLRPAVFELAWYAALAGCSMALLTPNLLEPFPSLADAQYFACHLLPVVAALYLVWTRQARPRRGSVARMMLATNILAAADGTLDWIYGSNYMYLRQKPVNVSLLSFLGPWPWYIASAEAVALGFFLLLYLPFWHGNATQPLGPTLPQQMPDAATPIPRSTEF
jgi:hypothetical integral membrane protein (TIGR02206 family)